MAILGLALAQKPPNGSKGCNKNLPKNSKIGDFRKIKLKIKDDPYVGQIDRTYQIRLPKGYDNKAALPLVYKAHGMGGSSNDLKDCDFAKLAKDREDFILVLVDGINKNWNTTNPEGVYGKSRQNS